MNKQEIISYNSSLGIETKFFSDPFGVHGYTENSVIYLNEAYMSLDKVNKHEILHLYENTMAFKMVKESLLEMLSEKEKQEIHDDYQLRYAGLYSKEEIEDGILDTEFAIDIIIGNGEFAKEITDFADGMFELITNSEKVPAITKDF